MQSEPRFRDQVREAFQDQVDRFEQTTGQGLDRLARHGLRERAQMKEQLREEWREDPGFRAATHSGKSRSRRPPHSHRAPAHPRFRKRRRRSRDRGEARAIRRARRRAAMRLAFVTHLGTFIGTLGIIGLATRSPRIVGIVGLSWGIGVFLHYVLGVWAPSWRDRSVEEEVGTRSPRAVAHERQRVESRSRRSMEDLSAGVAREIRNPINAAKRLVQQMGEDPGAEANIEHAERALAELDRVERSISHLLRYARDEEPRFHSLRLRSVAETAVAAQRGRAERLGVELNLDFDSEGPIRGDEEKLARVLESLISNALDAFEHLDPRSEGQTDPMIEIAGGESRSGNQVWVGVADNGPGIPPSERERIWSPFFTTKTTGGQGLGLALSRKTIEAHGGRIDLVPGRACGSEFLMSFPKDPEQEVGHAR